jgi:glycosyltransferase involved in cell wall biosynthesis
MKPPVEVSVLMPVYNAAPYVADAIESILAQTFTDFELLISDNASTDRTPVILAHYAQADSRIRVVRRPVPSLVQSLNALIELSRGEFLARMDGDDLALPTRFAEQVAFLREHSSVVCVGTSYSMIDNKGRRLRTVELDTDNRALEEAALRGINPIAHPTVMMRRDAVVAVGGYDVRFDYVEDLDLWLRLGEVGLLANLPGVKLKYRVHDKSRSLEDIHRQAECVRAAVEAAYVRRNIHREYVAPPLVNELVGRQRRHKEAVSRSYWAFKHGERRTSLLYATVAIWLAPWRILGWKMVIRGLLGV